MELQYNRTDLNQPLLTGCIPRKIYFNFNDKESLMQYIYYIVMYNQVDYESNKPILESFVAMCMKLGNEDNTKKSTDIYYIKELNRLYSLLMGSRIRENHLFGLSSNYCHNTGRIKYSYLLRFNELFKIRINPNFKDLQRIQIELCEDGNFYLRSSIYKSCVVDMNKIIDLKHVSVREEDSE